MLKSTYQPAPTQPLPPGWTEHKAPTGHTYYYNAITKESTYRRPEAPIAPPSRPSGPSLSDPRVANAYMAQLNQAAQTSSHNRGGFAGRGRGGGRGGHHDGRPKPQPVDKPRKAEAIPGHEPWMLVYTKYSRRFVYHPEKNASYWRIPEKLMPGILELDKARIRQKTERAEKLDEQLEKSVIEPSVKGVPEEVDGDSSEYEEVDVTDNEDENDHEGEENPYKRQRIDEGPVEFTEDDIAAQLAAMGEDYGLEPGDYDDGNMKDWPEGAEGLEFSEEDAQLLFKDLLNDLGINPYSPWDKLIEEGKIIEDPRYTALGTTKARRQCWDEWTREKIQAQKDERARQEKKDPRIAYMAFLQEKATPKLYWPEFKRKYKKEPPMKDLNLSDKDREKAYRDHIARLKQPQATRKSDLTALLKAQHIHVLHNQSLSTGLPTQILIDGRYIALEPSVRDPLVEAYVRSLPPPPVDVEGAAADEEARERRERRMKALEERDRQVEEQRRKRHGETMRAKMRLRDGEREREMAMRVGKGGLRSQLVEKEVVNDEDELPTAEDKAE